MKNMWIRRVLTITQLLPTYKIMENIFLILIAVVVLGFVWLMWARQHLLSHMHSFQRREVLLRRDFQKRRDIVPYLLDSFRAKHEVNPQWSELLEKRKAFHKVGEIPFKEELEFEEVLLNFVHAYDISDVNYLEAENDILKITEIIKESKLEWKKEENSYNAIKKRFPYSVASVMFGFAK
ncbi:MAG: hypothetical protein ACI9QC_000311 [Oceanicoccus sp.]